jgi:hypothetical protein
MTYDEWINDVYAMIAIREGFRFAMQMFRLTVFWDE